MDSDYTGNEKYLELAIKLIEQIGESTPIYHYTSPQGLESILKNQKLWFTDSNFLNDYSENMFFYSMTGIALKTEASKIFSEDFRKNVIELLENESVNNSNYQQFVASFSLNKDSLPLWNYYSKNNNGIGYNIEFNNSKLLKDFQNNNDFIIKSGKVIYN